MALEQGRATTRTLPDGRPEAPAGDTGGRDHDQDRDMVVRAVASAPSLHNAQPWLVRIRPDRVELYRDTSRALAVIDPHGREATISCGAALFGIRLAVAMQGRQAVVPLLPDPQTPTHLATVLPGPSREASPDEERMFEAMPRRRWHRQRFAPHPVPEHVVAELETVVREEGAWVREVRSRPHRARLVELSERAAGVLLRSRSYREELVTWHRKVRAGRGGSSGRPSPHLVPGLRRAPFPVGDMSHGDPWQDRTFVVGSDSDDPRGWLVAGQALHRLLLTATLRGLAASLLTQVVEVPGCRDALAAALRLPGPPQYVVRVGHPTVAPSGTPSRPVEDVVLG